MKYNPLVSIVIPTKNSGKLLEKCLISLINQTYKKLEIIIVDGYSTDNTLDIAGRYNTRIVMNKKILAEPGVDLGFRKSKGEIIIVMATDNIFKQKTAITLYVKVFSNKQVSAAFPIQVSSKKDTIFTKYVNVFTDPFNHFVYGYAANSRTFNKIYETILHNDLYDIYDYQSHPVKPIIAVAQGFAFRQDFKNKKRNKMDDIEPILKLIEQKKQIAYVHSVDLYHHTIRDVWHFIRKQRWAANNALTKKNYGIHTRINTLTNFQKIKAYLFPVYSISVVFPCFNSIYHLVIDMEPLWLFHPIITFISGASIIYEYARIKTGISRNISRL